MPLAVPRAASRAFQRAHPRLEHADGRVGIAAIDEAFLVALEARLGLLGAVIDIAGVEEDGLGGFAELAAQRAFMHKLRRRAPGAFARLGPFFADHGRHSLFRRRAQKNPGFGCRQKTGIGLAPRTAF